MVDYIGPAVEGLGNSSLYVDSAAGISSAGDVAAAYDGSGVAVVVLPPLATTTFSPGALAEQVLTQVDYNTVIVVVDSAYDSFGVAGDNSTLIATTLNSNHSGDAGATLLAHSGEVLEAREVTSTVTDTAPPEEGGVSPIMWGAGGLVLALTAIMAVAVTAHKRKSTPAPVEVAPQRLVVEDHPLPADLQESYEKFENNLRELEVGTREWNLYGESRTIADKALASGTGVLKYLHELYERLDRGNNAQARMLATVEYRNRLDKLSRAVSDNYLLDMLEHPELWDDPQGRGEQVHQAVTAVRDELIGNIKKLNASKDLEFTVALESLIKAVDTPTVKDAYKN